MKTRLFLPLVLIFALLSTAFTACESRGRDVFAFADSDATFILTFEGEAGEVVCECDRVGERITATVTSPERSRGIVITTGESGTHLSVDGTRIPLSENAARGFTAIFDVMFRGSKGAQVRMSKDGKYTEAVYEDGVIGIDGEGVPVSVDVGRVVKISNYKAKE